MKSSASVLTSTFRKWGRKGFPEISITFHFLKSFTFQSIFYIIFSSVRSKFLNFRLSFYSFFLHLIQLQQTVNMIRWKRLWNQIFMWIRGNISGCGAHFLWLWEQWNCLRESGKAAEKDSLLTKISAQKSRWG